MTDPKPSFFRRLFLRGNEQPVPPEVTAEECATVPNMDQFKADIRWYIENAEELGPLTNDALFDMLISQGMNRRHAIEIFTFLPVIFCRLVFPEVKYSPTYIEQFANGTRVRKNYIDNAYCRVMAHEAHTYMAKGLSSEKLLALAGRSAEFNVLNKLSIAADKEGRELKFSEVSCMESVHIFNS